jgi:hypothetical protein
LPARQRHWRHSWRFCLCFRSCCFQTNSPPSTVDRSVTGAIIGFNYANGVAGGTKSAILEIKTNAKSFGPGFISVINEGTATVAGLAPTAAVPEPATWGMMLIGFAGLGFAFKQSRRKVLLT